MEFGIYRQLIYSFYFMYWVRDVLYFHICVFIHICVLIYICVYTYL